MGSPKRERRLGNTAGREHWPDTFGVDGGHRRAETIYDSSQNRRIGVEVALEVSYTSPSHFARVFRRVTGVTPKEFRSAL